MKSFPLLVSVPTKPARYHVLQAAVVSSDVSTETSKSTDRLESCTLTHSKLSSILGICIISHLETTLLEGLLSVYVIHIQNRLIVKNKYGAHVLLVDGCTKGGRVFE